MSAPQKVAPKTYSSNDTDYANDTVAREIARITNPTFAENRRVDTLSYPARRAIPKSRQELAELKK